MNVPTCFLTLSPLITHTHHVLHLFRTLELSLAFQPFHIVCLFLILQIDTYQFIVICTAFVHIYFKRTSSCQVSVSDLLLLCFDPPGQQLGYSAPFTALILIIAVLGELLEADKRFP